MDRLGLPEGNHQRKTMTHALRKEQTLNGQWRLVLDPSNVGIRETWYSKPPDGNALTVQVPSVWDLWVPDYDGVGWYFREFELDASWTERRVALQFDAVDYYADIWLNGVCLGAHEGGYTPFTLEATKALCTGVNRLAVRVVDPHGEGFGDFRPKEIPCSKEEGYFTFAGIWGSVRLVATAPAFIEDVFVEPDMRRKRVGVTVAVSLPGEMTLTIEGTSNTVTGAPGKLYVDFPEYELWSTENPKLYTLHCVLSQDGKPVDALSVRFGMREFTVKENRFCLNGRPLFIKGILHQPDYARSLVAPETPELARRELELAKEAGFNLVRLHIKTAPTITLDLADELGLLVYAEPPIGWIARSAKMRERCEREVREMILRDRNHASIVIWGMLNETGNAGYVTNGGAQVIKDDLCKLARSLDPSRLIIDDSGGVNATREPARMMRPYHDTLEAYDDLHIYQRAPVDRDTELYYMHSGDPGMLYFLSEFGFGGMEDLADVIAQYGDQADTLKDARFLKKLYDAVQKGFETRDLGRVFGDFSGFTAAARDLQCDAVRRQVDACRANAKLAGYCYTQLCDAGHEFCAGILDRWRRPKPVLQTFQDVHKPLRPVIQVPRTNLVPREEVPVSISLINDLQLEGQAELSLQVVGPTNQVLWKKKRGVKIPRSGKVLWEGAIGASGSGGTHRFVVRLLRGMQVLGENSIELFVFDPVDPSGLEVNVLDPQRVWAERCIAFAKLAAVQAPLHIIPPLANTIRAYPDNDLIQILAQVKEGAVAIFFGPPDDWNDLAEHLDGNLTATSKDAVGAFLGVYHYAKLHPVFDGLPARGLMRQPYRNVVPAKTFVETSDEDICGSFNTAPAGSGNYMMEDADWWGSDLLVHRYGSGRIVLTHLRVLEHLGMDPVADRLFVNILRHFSRRSVPPDHIVPLDQKAVEWLRRERNDHTRRWAVIGPFANWGGKGHDTEYPPEKELNFDATYPGWYAAVNWKQWHARTEQDLVIDLQDAFAPIFEYYPRFDNGVGYAYAEISSERRQLAIAKIGYQNATKVWFNGTLIHNNTDYVPHDQFHYASANCTLKQGRNTILVKVSKIPGPFKFSCDLVSGTKEPLLAKWWR